MIPSIFGVSVISYYSFLYFLKKSIKNEYSYTPQEIFINYRKKIFLELWENDKANDNIDKSLYDHEKYKLMILKKTDSEKLWESRVLFDHTPSGNIIMFYDIYKHGFSYASDQTVPYIVLCGSAMRYCKLFQCRDFFRDNQYTKNEELSPFTIMEIEDEKREKMKSREKRRSLNLDLNSDAFLKPKPKKTTNTDNGIKVKEYNNINLKEKDYYTNTFRCVGKLRDFDFIQKYTPKHVTFESPKSYKQFKIKAANHQYFNNFFR